MTSTFREWVVQNSDRRVVPEDASINEVAESLLQVASSTPECQYPGCEELQFVDSEYCCQGHELLHTEYADDLDKWTLEEKLDRLRHEWTGLEIQGGTDSEEAIWTLTQTGDGIDEPHSISAETVGHAVDRALIETVLMEVPV